MCATLKDYPCPMYEIINFNIRMLHFVLFHNVTCYTNFLSSRMHVNTTKLYNIMCMLVATSVILWSLECIYHKQCNINKIMGTRNIMHPT